MRKVLENQKSRIFGFKTFQKPDEDEILTNKSIPNASNLEAKIQLRHYKNHLKKHMHLVQEDNKLE